VLRTIAVAAAALMSVGLAGATASAAPAGTAHGLCVIINYQVVKCLNGNEADAGQYLKKADGLWNNAYPGGLDDALVYWGPNRTGAWLGICNGTALYDLRQWTFPGGAAGHGQPLWHNIASFKWADLGGLCA
jgi:hypothetical protein